MRGLHMDSSHFLQKVIIKQKLLIIYREKFLQFQKWNKSNTQNPINRSQYRTLLYNRVKNTVDQQESNEDWEHTKTAITASAKETIQLQDTSPENIRWDEGFKQAIKDNTARMKCLQQKTRTNQATL